MFLSLQKYRAFGVTPRNSNGHFCLQKNSNLLIYCSMCFCLMDFLGEDLETGKILSCILNFDGVRRSLNS